MSEIITVSLSKREWLNIIEWLEDKSNEVDWCAAEEIGLLIEKLEKVIKCQEKPD